MDKGRDAGWRLRRPGDAIGRSAVKLEGSEPQWPTTLMVVGIFLFLVVFWSLGQLTLIGFIDLFRWFALFAFAGNFLPGRWWGKTLGRDRMDRFWFNLLAVGPAVFSCALLLNFFTHGPEQKMLVPGVSADFDLHGYWREHGELPDHLPWPADFGNTPEKDQMALSTARTGGIVFGLAQGGLGYFVITDRVNVRELGSAVRH